ncbi:hypothetical protein GCM10009087_55170 [Sphingomonas oligophenolica]
MIATYFNALKLLTQGRENAIGPRAGNPVPAPDGGGKAPNGPGATLPVSAPCTRRAQSGGAAGGRAWRDLTPIVAEKFRLVAEKFPFMILKLFPHAARMGQDPSHTK